jgi:hypothetical protein
VASFPRPPRKVAIRRHPFEPSSNPPLTVDKYYVLAAALPCQGGPGRLGAKFPVRIILHHYGDYDYMRSQLLREGFCDIFPIMKRLSNPIVGMTAVLQRVTANSLPIADGPHSPGMSL